jgi:hypothetical protein
LRFHGQPGCQNSLKANRCRHAMPICCRCAGWARGHGAL